MMTNMFQRLAVVPKWNVAAAIALAGFLATGAPVANATIIALDSNRGVGNQAWNGSLGMDFDVLAPITVTHLGAFDSNQDGIFFPGGDEQGTITVGIFDRNTQALVVGAVFITSADPLTGQSRYQDILDVTLGAGQYSIVAQGYNVLEPNGNLAFGGAASTIDTGGGLIAFVGGSRFSTNLGVFEYPLSLDAGPANRYDAGTFMYVAAVPEPGTLALLGTALVALGFVARRRASSA